MVLVCMYSTLLLISAKRKVCARFSFVALESFRWKNPVFYCLVIKKTYNSLYFKGIFCICRSAEMGGTFKNDVFALWYSWLAADVTRVMNTLLCCTQVLSLRQPYYITNELLACSSPPTVSSIPLSWLVERRKEVLCQRSSSIKE